MNQVVTTAWFSFDGRRNKEIDRMPQNLINHFHPPKEHRSSFSSTHSHGSIMHADKRRKQLLARARHEREIADSTLRKEKISMLITTFLAFIGGVIWIVAVSTEEWYSVYDQKEESVTEHPLIPYRKYGLWKSCTTRNVTKGSQCMFHTIFPSEAELVKNPFVDADIVDYARTEICFAIISLLLMLMALIFAFYTFKNPRYMFKRLTGFLFFITAGCTTVVLEVLITSAHHEQQLIKESKRMEDSFFKYGFSFYMGWSVMVINLVSGCVFVVCSSKKKIGNAPEVEADRDQVIGR